MSYEVRIAPAAQRQYRKLPVEIRKRVGKALGALAEEPRPAGVVKLRGSSNRRRIRVSDYRVIYQIEDEVVLVTVLAIAHRREVYR
jgi:mRNA interferase RelE/StbE